MKDESDLVVCRVFCITQGAWWTLTESMFRGVAIYDQATCSALPEQAVRAWAGQQRYATLLRGGAFVLRVRDSTGDYWYEFTWSLGQGLTCDYTTVYRGPYRDAPTLENPHVK